MDDDDDFGPGVDRHAGPGPQARLKKSEIISTQNENTSEITSTQNEKKVVKRLHSLFPSCPLPTLFCIATSCSEEMAVMTLLSQGYPIRQLTGHPQSGPRVVQSSSENCLREKWKKPQSKYHEETVRWLQGLFPTCPLPLLFYIANNCPEETVVQTIQALGYPISNVDEIYQSKFSHVMSASEDVMDEHQYQAPQGQRQVKNVSKAPYSIPEDFPDENQYQPPRGRCQAKNISNAQYSISENVMDEYQYQPSKVLHKLRVTPNATNYTITRNVKDEYQYPQGQHRAKNISNVPYSTPNDVKGRYQYQPPQGQRQPKNISNAPNSTGGDDRRRCTCQQNTEEAAHLIYDRFQDHLQSTKIPLVYALAMMRLHSVFPTCPPLHLLYIVSSGLPEHVVIAVLMALGYPTKEQVEESSSDTSESECEKYVEYTPLKDYVETKVIPTVRHGVNYGISEFRARSSEFSNLEEVRHRLYQQWRSSLDNDVMDSVHEDTSAVFDQAFMRAALVKWLRDQSTPEGQQARAGTSTSSSELRSPCGGLRLAETYFCKSLQMLIAAVRVAVEGCLSPTPAPPPTTTPACIMQLLEWLNTLYAGLSHGQDPSRNGGTQRLDEEYLTSACCMLDAAIRATLAGQGPKLPLLDSSPQPSTSPKMLASGSKKNTMKLKAHKQAPAGKSKSGKESPSPPQYHSFEALKMLVESVKDAIEEETAIKEGHALHTGSSSKPRQMAHLQPAFGQSGVSSSEALQVLEAAIKDTVEGNNDSRTKTAALVNKHLKGEENMAAYSDIMQMLRARTSPLQASMSYGIEETYRLGNVLVEQAQALLSMAIRVANRASGSIGEDQPQWQEVHRHPH